MDPSAKKKLHDDVQAACLLFKEATEKAGMDQWVTLALCSPDKSEPRAPGQVEFFFNGSFNPAGLGNLIAGILSQIPAECVGQTLNVILTHPMLQGRGFTAIKDPVALPPKKPTEYMN